MHSDTRESPYHILVTGIGGAPGFDLARGLLRHGCHVIGVDANPLAWGLQLPGITPRTMPPAGHPDYGPVLLEVCRELRPDAILPTVEQELTQLVTMHQQLTDVGVTAWLPDARAVDACADKARLYTVLTEHGIPTPRTFLPEEVADIPDGQRLVVKPRRGQGAKDVYFCWTRSQARTLCELVPEPIVQERVDGSEFTADCLVDRSGRASIILRHRLLVKGGLSMVSRTFCDETVAQQVAATLAAVGIVGPCCAQGFICDNDRVLITELNARVAGGFLASEAAGADLVGQILNGLFRLPVDHEALRYRPGTCLTKYIETLTTTTEGED